MRHPSEMKINTMTPGLMKHREVISINAAETERGEHSLLTDQELHAYAIHPRTWRIILTSHGYEKDDANAKNRHEAHSCLLHNTPLSNSSQPGCTATEPALSETRHLPHQNNEKLNTDRIKLDSCTKNLTEERENRIVRKKKNTLRGTAE